MEPRCHPKRLSLPSVPEAGVSQRGETPIRQLQEASLARADLKASSQ